MNDKYKKILPFLENNIDLINSNQFEKLYAILPTVEFSGILTELFLKAGINPLQYMDLIPPYFLLESKISSIDIPNTITTIRREAFFDANIRKLVIPSSVKNIQKGAFYKSYIEKIIFSAYNDLDIIPEKCFSRSINLSSVDIPDHTTEIGPEAFAYCSSLKYIDLKKVHVLKSHCFAGSGLVAVTLPETVQEVEKGVFDGCHNLVKVVIDNPHIHMKNIFTFCLSLSEIIFHGTIDQAKQVFEDIYIPKNILIKCIDGGFQI